MRINYLTTLLILVFLVSGTTQAQQKPTDAERLAWWHEAKFGMFINWGIHSLYGGEYKGHQQARGGAEWIMNRPQIQEEAVVQLANMIQERTHPDGLAIVMQATHYCMAWRGVKDMDSRMINSVMRGVFLKDPSLRREFLALIPQKD